LKIWSRRIATLAGAAFISGAGIGSLPELSAGEVGRVSSVLDGDTLYLEGGLKVRLSAMQAQKVGLYYGGERRDRYDRALAQVFTLDNKGHRDLWVQEEMIRLGMARVYTWPDTYQNSGKLYAAEREARGAGRGIWSHPYYVIRNPEPNMLAQDVDSFQLVEGIITSSADIRGRVYLNFGADYKTD